MIGTYNKPYVAFLDGVTSTVAPSTTGARRARRATCTDCQTARAPVAGGRTKWVAESACPSMARYGWPPRIRSSPCPVRQRAKGAARACACLTRAPDRQQWHAFGTQRRDGHRPLPRRRRLLLPPALGWRTWHVPGAHRLPPQGLGCLVRVACRERRVSTPHGTDRRAGTLAASPPPPRAFLPRGGRSRGLQQGLHRHTLRAGLSPAGAGSPSGLDGGSNSA